MVVILIVQKALTQAIKDFDPAGNSDVATGSKSFIAWVSAFWTINITTIAYTIMVSLLVSVIDSGRGIESYIFAQLIGWGLPTLAIAFGAGGGFTLYSSFIAIGVGASGGFSTSKMISAIKPSFGK